MDRKAKSISCDVLADTGAKVAEFLKSERDLGLSDAEIALFPDHCIFGGRQPLDKIGDLSLGTLADVSGKIASGIIGPQIAVKPEIAILDRILIFGGRLDPDILIGR